MHELVDLGHSMTHAAVDLCRDETRTSEHVGISPAEEGWTVANNNEMYLVAALTCNVLQHPRRLGAPQAAHQARYVASAPLFAVWPPDLAHSVRGKRVP
jgi:hypothetical protein